MDEQERRWSPPSPGTVISIVALFVALSGTALALQKNSVTSKTIKTGAVKSSDIGDGQVTSTDVQDGSLAGIDVADNGLTGSDVDESTLALPPDPTSLPPNGPAAGSLAGSYPDPSVAANAIGTNEVDGSLTGADIVESSLTGVNADTLGGNFGADAYGSGTVLGRINGANNTTPLFGSPTGTSNADATESDVHYIAPSFDDDDGTNGGTLTDMFAELSTGVMPGGTSRTVTLRAGGADGPFCLIPAGDDNCSFNPTGSINVNRNQNISIKVDTTGAPGVQDILFGYRIVND